MAIFVGYFLAYISRWFILLLPQLSELFLFPTFRQDSRNIFGKRLSVFAFSTMRYSLFFDIRKSSILADFIRISNNFLEITACCKSLISVQTIQWTRDFPLWNSLLIFHITLFDILYLSPARILSQGTRVLA